MLRVKPFSDTIGLWQEKVEVRLDLRPVGPTARTLLPLVQEDAARRDTYGEIQRLISDVFAKTPDLSSVSKALGILVGEYEESGELPPAAVTLWSSYAQLADRSRSWRHGPEPGGPVRVTFGQPMAGMFLIDAQVRRSKTMILRGVEEGVEKWFVAVTLRGVRADDWDELLEPSPRSDVYERYAFDGRSESAFRPMDARLLRALVANGKTCLFEIVDPSPLFLAVMDRANARLDRATLTGGLEFYAEGDRFFGYVNIVFNPGAERCRIGVRNSSRVWEAQLEIMPELAGREILVRREEDIEPALRRAVQSDGVILMDADASEALLEKVRRRLRYLWFADIPVDSPGGALRGYLSFDRLMQRKKGASIRGGDLAKMKRGWDEKGGASRARRTEDCIDQITDRVLACFQSRNVLPEGMGLAELRDELRLHIAGECERLGMFRGQALYLFCGGELKMPSEAVCMAFETLLRERGVRLESSGAVSRLVQTIRALPLEQGIGSQRALHRRSYPLVPVEATAEHLRGLLPTANPGEPVEFAFAKTGDAHNVRDYLRGNIWLLEKGGEYYVLARMPFEFFEAQDLCPEADSECGRGEDYRRFRFTDATRDGATLQVDVFDPWKLNRFVESGQAMLFALDVGEDRKFFDALGCEEGVSPCPVAIVGGIRFWLYPNGALTADVPLTFNSWIPQSGRKLTVRSLSAYLDAFPEDAVRPLQFVDATSVPADVLAAAVANDGFIVFPSSVSGDGRAENPALQDVVDQILDGASYLFDPGLDPHAPGGALRGYQIRDRVFRLDASDRSDGGDRRTARRENVGLPLEQVLSPSKCEEAKAQFRTRVYEEFGRRNGGAPIARRSALDAALAREFSRIVYTGTMTVSRQLTRYVGVAALGVAFYENMAARRINQPVVPTGTASVKVPAKVLRTDVSPADEPSAPDALAATLAARLKKLERLREMGLITEAELSEQRGRILSEI